MYKVKNVCFTYPDNEKVIDNLSFEINKGDFVVICGESGCGKTTLLRLLKSSLQPTGTLEGTIELDEQIKKDILDARRKLPDVIIACMHWGVEYCSFPERSECELANWLI